MTHSLPKASSLNQQGEGFLEEDLKEVWERCPQVRDLEGASCLITGASGMLAAYMAHTVIWLNNHVFQKKCHLTLLGRNAKKLKAKFSYAEESSSITFVVQDVTAPFSNALKGFDYIVHAASPADPRGYSADPLGTIRCNTAATERLLTLANRSETKGFLFFSSASVYGCVTSAQIPTAEDQFGSVDPLGPRACYEESKRMGETTCLSYWKEYGVPVKIVRPAHIYGPGMTLGDGRVFSDFIKNALEKEPIEVTGDGKTLRTFCYIADANVAFWKTLFLGKPGEAYNVGNDETELTIYDFAHIVARLSDAEVISSPQKNKESVGGAGKAVTRRLLDIKKIKELGFSPLYGVEEGVQRVLKSFSYNQ